MKKSVIFEFLRDNEEFTVVFGTLWFFFVGGATGFSVHFSGVNYFQSVLVGLGFALSPLLVGMGEIIVRSLLPSEERNLERAKTALQMAKLRLETEKTLIEARRIEQDRLKISDAAINSELLEAARVADMAHSDTRNGHHRLVSKL